MRRMATIQPEDFSARMEALPLSPLPSRLAVAVSGGADSMALALLAADWAAHHDISLIAYTVDHGLRPEAAAEAIQVGQWLSTHGIRHRTLRWEYTEKPTSNLQASAREARYRLLAQVCAEEGISHLLLGHHQDDQAETFLIRLQRGSGVDGLAAMRPVSTFSAHGVLALTLLRPLLDVPKSALIAFLRAQGQAWIEDPSNHSGKHTRTHMRQLLPALEATGITAETLSATSQRMARARSYLEQQTAEAAARCLTLHDAGYISLHWPHFSTLHPEIALRVLADILRLMNGSAYRPRLSELENLYAALPEARTLAGCRFIPQTGKANSDTMLILRELAHIAPPQQLMPHQPTLWDGRFEVTLLSDTPAEISGWGESAPEGELHLPKRAVPVLPVIRLEKAFSIPHIPYETGEDARASTSGIRCEIRTFPLRGNLGYS